MHSGTRRQALVSDMGKAFVTATDQALGLHGTSVIIIVLWPIERGRRATPRTRGKEGKRKGERGRERESEREWE